MNFDYECNNFMLKKGEENMGMPMIYTMCSALIEKMNKDNEERKVQEENERDRIREEKEAEEMVTFLTNGLQILN